ncbi:MAG: hypothetical protein ACLPID_11760 [Beijerinckiaceae bacterium]
MSESQSHSRAKAQAAGKNGETEVPLPGGRRLDAKSASGRATEIERGGTDAGLQAAARRLRDADANQHVLQVPQRDMDAAAAAMRKVGVHGTVKNMTGSKRRPV